MANKINIFWFRRDLRLEDNTGLIAALLGNAKVLPIFIFDENILNELPKSDARVHFIYEQLSQINQALKAHQSGIKIIKGKPLEVWKYLMETYSIEKVFINKDYEPYARKRDYAIHSFLENKGVEMLHYKDQVMHEEFEVVKADRTPYTVFTPYKNKWLQVYQETKPLDFPGYSNFLKNDYNFPSLAEIGFEPTSLKVRPYTLNEIANYGITRDFPEQDGTSYLGPHLRFGTVSVRQIIAQIGANDRVFLSELIWREFFMQILFHFPKVVTRNFKSKYDAITWRNNPEEIEKWKQGKTGYPLVDAGMRQLNATGYMHNRVRMVTAGFLCKHLLTDWSIGEAYFAEKLVDYELASNNGNWQWAAGTGCDSAPYFRIFNPIEQLKKFDKDWCYVKKWVPEVETEAYPKPMVDHKWARQRALDAYKKGLGN